MPVFGNSSRTPTAPGSASGRRSHPAAPIGSTRKANFGIKVGLLNVLQPATCLGWELGAQRRAAGAQKNYPFGEQTPCVRYTGTYPSPTRYPGIKDLETSFAKPLIKRDFGEKAINGPRSSGFPDL